MSIHQTELSKQLWDSVLLLQERCRECIAYIVYSTLSYNWFSDQAREYGLPEPRGMFMLGVQGCGKSLMAKAVADHGGVIEVDSVPRRTEFRISLPIADISQAYLRA